MVEGVEVDVGEELAREIADGKAATVLERREEVVTGVVPHHGLLLV
jgi:hypothetical protein